MADEPRRKCFVIGPIGDPDTDTRNKADLLLKVIIRPALEPAPLSFDVTRADEISEPGLITGQIINAVITSDMIVADLTGWNANAFYELALAHTEGKPVIHMIEDGEKLPFDVQEYRTVGYRVDKFDVLESAKKELVKQAKIATAEGYEVSNPVTSARGQGRLARSDDPNDKLIADLIEGQKALNLKVSRLEAATEAMPATGMGFGSGLPSLSDLLTHRDFVSRLTNPNPILSDAIAKQVEPTSGGLLGAILDQADAEVAPAEQPTGHSDHDHGDAEEEKS